MFSTLFIIRMVVVLGFINLVTGGLIFLSCRCLHGSWLSTRLMKYKVYQRFYKYHCYLWRIFWPSVMIHIILVTISFGWWPG